MANKVYSTIMFYSNFPINSYSNQYYNTSRTNRNDVFDAYCNVRLSGQYQGKVKGVNYFTNQATVDLTNLKFRLQLDNPDYEITSAYRTAMDYNYGVLIQEGKRYYFFVDNIEWSSNLITATFHCTCDWWQTYCYDITFKKSFIEREHVKNDTFGAHILDENLPITEYICNSHSGNEGYMTSDDLHLCLVLSDNEYVVKYDDTTKKMPLYDKYGMSYRLLTVAFPNTKEGKENLQKTIDVYVSNNKIDSIQGMYVAQCPIPALSHNAKIHTDTDICECNVLLDDPVYNNTLTATKLNTLNGYPPKNNKTKCFPYSFCNITNFLGNSIIAKYEFANDKNTIDFRFNFPSTQGASGNGYLRNYDGINGANLDYSLSTIVNPELPWVSNTYSAYYSANQNRINASYNIADRIYNTKMTVARVNNIADSIKSFGTAMGNMGSGVLSSTASGNPFGVAQAGMSSGTSLTNQNISVAQNMLTTAISGLTQKRNTYDEINATLADMESKGDIAHGSFIPHMLSDMSKVGFQLQQMTVTYECAEMVDHYFSMFGYKVNRIDVPTFNHRKNWDFIKTSSLNIVGNVPQIAINIIKEMFNSGTTIWHSLGRMYDYGDFNNPIV